jgi:hypothetical protein
MKSAERGRDGEEMGSWGKSMGSLIWWCGYINPQFLLCKWILKLHFFIYAHSLFSDIIMASTIAQCCP